MMYSYAIGIATLFGCSFSSALPNSGPQRRQSWRIGQTVSTSSGTVTGHHAPWPPSSGVSEYLGIPFGQNPVGSLRFAAPQRYEGQGKPVSGDKWSEECLQLVQGAIPAMEDLGVVGEPIAFAEALGGLRNTTFGEDCLKLNIWTKPQIGEAKKAVMIWIYGGAYAVGATSVPYYNAARYAKEQDVVAVSINYRLNVFGFPGTTFLPDNNLGLLDQRLAVEWARDNIAAFGGDPKRITIFGESAGGASVDYYSYAWTKDPIVAGLIAQSGTSPGLNGNAADDTRWFTVSNAAGCGNGSSAAPEASLKCMRQLSAEKLLEASKKIGTTAGLTSFWPTVDGKTFFADTWDREKNGQFAKVPMLVGNLDHEGDIITGAGYMMTKWASSQWNRNALLGSSAKQLLDFLSNSNSTAVEGLRWILSFIEDGVFNCPAGEAAAARAKHGVPVWRYRFMGQWPNVQIGGKGSYHVSDVPLVMGTTERKKTATKNTPEEERLIINTMTAWATFAKDPVDGLTKLGWPKYNPTGKTLVRLGYQNTAAASFGQALEYDDNCPAMRHVQPADLAPIKITNVK